MSMSMLSCQRCTMLAAQNTSPFLHRFQRHRSRFRYLLDQIVVSPSLTSIFTSENVIVVAARPPPPPPLSTALSPPPSLRLPSPPSQLLPVLVFPPRLISYGPNWTNNQDGVDVTSYPIFNDPKA